MTSIKPLSKAPYSPWFTRKKATFSYSRLDATLVIHGKITDSERIHRSLLLLLENHFSENSHLTCHLELHYLDAPTTRVLFLLFGMFQKRQDLGCKITVFWADGGDTDLADTRDDFSDLFEIPVQCISA